MVLQTYLSTFAWVGNALVALFFAFVFSIYPTAFVLRAAGAPQNPRLPIFFLGLAPVFAVVFALVWYASALLRSFSSLVLILYVPLGSLFTLLGLLYSILVLLQSGIFIGTAFTRAFTSSSTPKGFLVDWLLPPDRAEEVLVNFLARYPYWIAKYGATRARLIFATQSVGSILSYWTDWLLRRLKLLTLLIRT